MGLDGTGKRSALSYRFWKIKEHSSQRYRADIDGLRAVAVLAVLIYHAFPEWSAGGFVGVDIFFVISGFLITGIILEGLEKKDFSYVDFYVRRIKRIFPPLILILVAALVVGWFVLFEDEYRQLGKHVAAGVAFVSNFILLREGGYFDIAAELKPLLHLWSLAIEEQFYLVWPLLLIWASRRASAIRLIVLLGAVSFAANIWLIYTRPSYAFYVSFPRFWELMLGSSLAYVIHSRGSRNLPAGPLTKWSADKLASGSRTFRNVAAAAGALLIVGAVFSFDVGFAFPGWWALIPTIGTFLIIAAGSEAWLNRVILSNEGMVSIGLISYPLYLWHWLLLYFARVISNGEPGAGAKWVAIALSLTLAALSFNYVEFPIRTASRGGRTAVALCAAMILIAAVGVMGYKSWIPTRPAEVWQRIAWARYDRNSPRSWDESRHLKPYYVGNAASPEILFFGDSHMETYYPRVERVVKDFSPVEKGVAFSTAGGCPPLPGVDRLDSAQPIGCSDFFRQTVEYAKRAGFKKIVLGAYWEGYFLGLHHGDTKGPVLYASGDARRKPIAPGTEEFKSLFRSLETELVEFTSTGVEVYIVLSNPAGRVLDPTEILSAYDRLGPAGQPLRSEASIDRLAFERHLAPVNDAFRSLSQRTGVKLIDPLPVLCERGRCGSMKNGRPIYTDDSHLTGWYVRNHATYIDNVFDFQPSR